MPGGQKKRPQRREVIRRTKRNKSTAALEIIAAGLVRILTAVPEWPPPCFEGKMLSVSAKAAHQPVIVFSETDKYNWVTQALPTTSQIFFLVFCQR
jgi:hypothetical protein